MFDDPATVKIHEQLKRRGFLWIAALVSIKHGIDLETVLARGRSKTVMLARRDLYLQLRMQGLSLPEIGSLLDRDHTTILHGLRPRGARKAALKPSTLPMALLFAGVA